MQFSRRGFLQTIATAMGAAALDPISKLWVPTHEPVALASAELLPHTVGSFGSAPTVTLSALDEMALEVAKAMAFRLDDPKTLAVGRIDFKPSSTHPGVLEIPGFRKDVFIPANRTMRVIDDKPLDQQTFVVNTLANELRYAVMGYEVFVPITRELRPGDAFSDDIEVGVGTDPETGLSVRVIRFEHEGLRRSTRRLLGVEMAGGRWHRARGHR